MIITGWKQICWNPRVYITSKQLENPTYYAWYIYASEFIKINTNDDTSLYYPVTLWVLIDRCITVGWCMDILHRNIDTLNLHFFKYNMLTHKFQHVESCVVQKNQYKLHQDTSLYYPVMVYICVEISLKYLKKVFFVCVLSGSAVKCRDKMA